LKTSADYQPCIAISRTHERKANTTRFDTVEQALEKIRNDRMAWVRPEDVEAVKAAMRGRDGADS
jgi:hypothetical protein